MEDKDIDKLLREKASKMDITNYEKTNVETIINLANQKKRKITIRRTLAASLCACICLALIVCVSIYKRNINNSDDIIIEGNEENNNNQNTYNNIVGTYLYEKNSTDSIDDDYAEYILIVEIKEVNDYGIKDDIPITEMNAKIIENIIGNKINENINILIESSVVSFENLPENIKKHYDKTDYVRLVTDKRMFYASIPEKGKYYIVSLYDEDGVLKVASSHKYPFNEFNIETRQVKVGDEWEDLNLDFLLG